MANQNLSNWIEVPDTICGSYTTKDFTVTDRGIEFNDLNVVIITPTNGVNALHIHEDSIKLLRLVDGSTQVEILDYLDIWAESGILYIDTNCITVTELESLGITKSYAKIAMRNSILLLIASLGGALVGSMLTAGVYTHEMSKYSNYYDKSVACIDSIAAEDEDLFLDIVVETGYYDDYLEAKEEVEQ